MEPTTVPDRVKKHVRGHHVLLARLSPLGQLMSETHVRQHGDHNPLSPGSREFRRVRGTRMSLVNTDTQVDLLRRGRARIRCAIFVLSSYAAVPVPCEQ